MYFQILGPLEAWSDRGPVDLGSPRQRHVLALLLARPDQFVTVDRLADDLWTGEPPKTARHTLQVYVHRLRKALGGEANRLETRADGYRLNVGVEELDALRFERMVGQARERRPGDPTGAAALLAEGLALWKGSVLADIPDLPALLPERARLDTMRTAALEDRIEADLALGRHAGLVEELEALVLEHPFRERLWGQLMLALYRSGRQAEALRGFQRAKKVLGEELGLAPGPWLVELEGRILLQDPSISAPAFTYEPPTDTLPRSRTSFRGRQTELSRLQALLQTSRLVTITGAPGVGKTRLAIEAARQAVDGSPHGTFFVSLADTDDPSLIASMVAAALGVTTPDHRVVEGLIDHLRRRRVLVLMDNLEHLADGVAVVGDLLASAPGLTILATSRAPLRLSGEHVYPLQPLPTPRPGDFPVDHDSNVAIALFADRAGAVDPQFAVTDDNIASVAEVVAAFDCLPLAIELAAARMGAIPLPELAARVDRALPLLSTGRADAHPRQRTLTDAIAWSHELLAPEHQAALRRLAVFRGGFTIEQAEAVAAGPPVEDVANVLLDLVESSLIRRPDDEGRFSMMETVREYALKLLSAAGEQEAIAGRHAEYFSDLVDEAESELTGRNQALWLDRLVVEYPNLRVALAWARVRQPERGLLMAGRLWRFWQFRGLLSDGRRWLEGMLSAGEEAGFPRIKALVGLAGICYWQADFTAAETHYLEALRLLDEFDDPLLRAEALFGRMTTLACHRGDVEAAVPLEKELHELATTSEHPVLAIMDIGASGAVRFYTRDWEGAESYMSQTLQMARDAGNRWLEREVLFGLASVSYAQGRLAEAEMRLRDALVIAYEMGHLQGVSLSLYWLAFASATRGDAEEAVTLAGAAARIRDEHGGGFVADDVGLVEMQDPVELARQSLDESDVDKAWAKGWAIGFDELLAAVVGPDGTGVTDADPRDPRF